MLCAGVSGDFGPIQQAVRIKGVEDAAATGGVKIKPHFGTTRLDVLVHLRLLFGARAVFLVQMFKQVLATFSQVWVEFKRLKTDVGFHFTLQRIQGLF